VAGKMEALTAVEMMELSSMIRNMLVEIKSETMVSRVSASHWGGFSAAVASFW
jgi:hypothetical protein